MLGGTGLVVALTPVDVGDSYCGTALYDTTLAAPCTSEMILRRVIAVLCWLGALAIVALIVAREGSARRRARRLWAVGVIGLSVVGGVVMVNRLLQPVRSEWCGSVLNRHRTYEPAIEARCDHLLMPFRNAAITVGIVAAVALVMGISLLWRSSVDAHDAPQDQS